MLQMGENPREQENFDGGSRHSLQADSIFEAAETIKAEGRPIFFTDERYPYQPLTKIFGGDEFLPVPKIS
jgi:hypothetical protein